MTIKPKTRKAPAPNGADPVFAAITEHKMLIKGSNSLEKSCHSARAKAEKKYGEWIQTPKPGEWPGEAIVSPLYDRWNRALRAARKAAMRMARTKPTTPAGAAAMITHARREIYRDSEGAQGWATIALKTAASSLARMYA